MNERRLVQKDEAMRILADMPYSTFSKLAAKREIPVVKIGAANYYDTADLWAWIESKKERSSLASPALAA
jgi:hypothetical protein